MYFKTCSHIKFDHRGSHIAQYLQKMQMQDTENDKFYDCFTQGTVKFLNFRTSENFAVIYLKFRKKRPNLRVFRQKDANEIANSEDPDQTAPLGAV